MFNQLNDNLKRAIYEYDPTYRHIYNIVLEEFKIRCILKHKQQFNNNSVKEWTKKIKQTREEDVNINITHILLNKLQTLLKQFSFCPIFTKKILPLNFSVHFVKRMKIAFEI